MQDHPPLSSESRMLLVLVGDDFEECDDFCGVGVDLILRAFDLEDTETEDFLKTLSITREDLDLSIRKFLSALTKHRLSMPQKLKDQRQRMLIESPASRFVQKARCLARSARAELVTPSHLVSAVLLEIVDRSPKNPIYDEHFHWIVSTIHQRFGVADEPGSSFDSFTN